MIEVKVRRGQSIEKAISIFKKKVKDSKILYELRENFKVSVDSKVSIFTIRHFNRNTLKHIKKLNQKVLLEQRTNKTLQLVLSKNFKEENLFGFFER